MSHRREARKRPVVLDKPRRLAYHTRLICGAIAQLGERNTGSVEVGGSIPPGSTKHLICL